MFGTSAEFFDGLSKLPKEVWSGVGTMLIAMVLAVLAKVSGRRADADKDARPVTPTQLGVEPGARTGVDSLTFLHDGTTERSILEEVRGLRADQRARYAAEDAQRAAEEHRRLEHENVDLREELNTLRAGQGKTHGNQKEMLSELADARGEFAEMNRRIDELMKALATK